MRPSSLTNSYAAVGLCVITAETQQVLLIAAVPASWVCFVEFQPSSSTSATMESNEVNEIHGLYLSGAFEQY